MKRKLFLSITDQVVVSGGNFITIALGAYILPIAEQGKLAYVVSAYMATVLLNVAAIFAVAPVVKHEAAEPASYRYVLFQGQTLLAVLTALVITTALHFLGERIGWSISAVESGVLLLFLILQQFADFKRRAAYVFDSVTQACYASLWTYGLRIGLLVVLQPSTILEVLAILAGGALLTALATVLESVKQGRASRRAGRPKLAICLHLHLCKWSVLNAPLGWACFFFPIFLLGALGSEKEAAVLVSVRSIGNAANIALELLETQVPVWLASTSAQHGRSSLKDASINLLRVGACLWALGLVVVWMFGGTLIGWLLGANYSAYGSILVISWFANGIHFLGRVVGLHYRTAKSTKVEFAGSLGGLAGLAIALPAIDRYGVIGGAWSYVLVSMGIVVAQFLCLKYWRGGLCVATA